MATVWNGYEMLEGLSDEEAQRMVDEDLGQWVEYHDGSEFKYRHEFTGYQNKAMATEVKVEEPENKVVKKKVAKKKVAKKVTKKVATDEAD